MKYSKVWFEEKNIISRVMGLLLATERDFGSSLSVLSTLLCQPPTSYWTLHQMPGAASQNIARIANAVQCHS